MAHFPPKQQPANKFQMTQINRKHSTVCVCISSLSIAVIISLSLPPVFQLACTDTQTGTHMQTVKNVKAAFSLSVHIPNSLYTYTRSQTYRRVHTHAHTNQLIQNKHHRIRLNSLGLSLNSQSVRPYVDGVVVLALMKCNY